MRSVMSSNGRFTRVFKKLLPLSYLSYDEKMAQIMIRTAPFEVRLLIGSGALGFIEFLGCRLYINYQLDALIIIYS